MNDNILEIVTNKPVVTVITTPMIVQASVGGTQLPNGGSLGQVLAQKTDGPGWSSLEDFSLWFDNQLL